jgi:hydrogenase 3 maturation protease
MKTSEPSWLRKTAKALTKRIAESDLAVFPLRLAILGIGNEMNGDDAAGVMAARRLKEHLVGRSNILIIDGGSTPENFSGPLRRFRPDWIILLDIGQMEAEPGTIEWLEMSEIEGVTAATHGLPVSLLAMYLMSETNCQVGALLIQPVSLEFERALSTAVSLAVDELVEGLAELLSHGIEGIIDTFKE